MNEPTRWELIMVVREVYGYDAADPSFPNIDFYIHERIAVCIQSGPYAGRRAETWWMLKSSTIASLTKEEFEAARAVYIQHNVDRLTKQSSAGPMGDAPSLSRGQDNSPMLGGDRAILRLDHLQLAIDTILDDLVSQPHISGELDFEIISEPRLDLT